MHVVQTGVFVVAEVIFDIIKTNNTTILKQLYIAILINQISFVFVYPILNIFFKFQLDINYK